jgi:hypothetical protein
MLSFMCLCIRTHITFCYCYTLGRLKGTTWSWSMAIGFTTTYAISANHHWSCEYKSRSLRGESVTTLCDKVCQWFVAGRCFSPGTPVSPQCRLSAWARRTHARGPHEHRGTMLNVQHVFLMFKHWFCWKYQYNKYMFNFIDHLQCFPVSGSVGRGTSALLCPGI